MPFVLPAMNIADVLRLSYMAIVALAALISLVFYYHWARYAPSHFGAIVTFVIYTLGLAALLLTMAGILMSI